MTRILRKQLSTGVDVKQTMNHIHEAVKQAKIDIECNGFNYTCCAIVDNLRTELGSFNDLNYVNKEGIVESIIDDIWEPLHSKRKFWNSNSYCKKSEVYKKARIKKLKELKDIIKIVKKDVVNNVRW